MTEQLLVRLPEVEGTALTWVEVDAAGRIKKKEQRGSMEQLALVAGEMPITLLLPGTRVWLTTTESPARNRQQLLKALPFALEDEFTEEVETLHFAIGEQEDGRIPVAVISRELMSGLKSGIEALGLQLNQVLTELHALPWHEDEWSLLSDGGRIYLRTGAYKGFSCETANGALLVQKAITDAKENRPSVVRYFGHGEQLQGVIDAFRLIGECRVETEETDSILAVLATGWSTTPHINLLQGQFGQQVPLSVMLDSWRPVAILSILWIVLSFGFLTFDYFSLQSEDTALQQRITLLFKQSMPGTQRMVNPKVQMRRERDLLRDKLAGGRGGFLDLLTRSGIALKDHDQIQLAGIGYREGRLDLELVTTELQLLDSLQQAIASTSGIEVKIESASSRNDQVRGRLAVTMQ